jgi:hypothetical protein
MTLGEKEKERNRLTRLYWERDKEFESAKGKRTILTIIGFTIAYFLILYAVEKPSGFDIVLAFIVALVMAGFHFFINSFIFMYLFQKGHRETECLEAIKKKIIELE